MATRAEAQAILEQLAGPDALLRDDQWLAIEALVVLRRRALVVQRTGWGKSAVYFIAAKLLRAAGHGATVIVSPLLALMRNQVAAADRAGVHAATINSSNVADWADIHQRVHGGELDVLLVSPERLNNPEFRDEVLPALARDAQSWPLLMNCSTTLDMSKLLPPWTGGYWASVVRCSVISAFSGPVCHATFWIRWP